MAYLGDIFCDSISSQTGNMMTSQMKSIILDLKSRAIQTLVLGYTESQRMY